MSGVIHSGFDEASEAVSVLVGIDTGSYRRDTVSVSSSNVAGMVSGVGAANRVLTDLAAVMNRVHELAGKFPALAEKIAERDLADSQRWGR